MQNMKRKRTIDITTIKRSLTRMKTNPKNMSPIVKKAKTKYSAMTLSKSISSSKGEKSI